MDHAPCCPPTAHPFVPPPADYKPRGAVETLKNGLEVYFVNGGAKPASRSLIVIPEVFGIDAGRLKNIADSFGDLGYLVALVNIHRNRHFVPPFDFSTFPKFCQSFPIASLLSDLESVHDALDLRLSPEKFPFRAIVGFCWGSEVSLLEASASQRLRVSCAATCHPSHSKSLAMTSDEERYQLPHLASTLRVPWCVLTAGDDDPRVKPDGEEHNIVKQSKITHVAQKSVYHTYEKANHGWFARGDVTNPDILASYQDASVKLQQFFDSCA